MVKLDEKVVSLVPSQWELLPKQKLCWNNLRNNRLQLE